MSTSKLKLNPDKTEFIILGSKRQRDKLKVCFPIDILGSPLCPVDSVRNLGVWFDSNFSLSKYVQNVCKSCFVKLCDFRYVRWFLTHDVSVLVANALVSSRLDYWNSLFRIISRFNLCTLQCIQNSGIGFLLMMFLYLWLMLLLAVGWITGTHFSGSSLGSIYAHYSASKIVE